MNKRLYEKFNCFFGWTNASSFGLMFSQWIYSIIFFFLIKSWIVNTFVVEGCLQRNELVGPFTIFWQVGNQPPHSSLNGRSGHGVSDLDTPIKSVQNSKSKTCFDFSTSFFFLPGRISNQITMLCFDKKVILLFH